MCLLEKLDHLNLEANEFKEFPKELKCLKKLRLLEINDNHISKIPDLEGMKRLREFCINGNPVGVKAVAKKYGKKMLVY